MKLIVAAFWVHDEDTDEAMKLVVSDPVPGIKGSGAAVSFNQNVAADPDLRRTLRRFDLDEAAAFLPEDCAGQDCEHGHSHAT